METIGRLPGSFQGPAVLGLLGLFLATKSGPVGPSSFSAGAPGVRVVIYIYILYFGLHIIYFGLKVVPIYVLQSIW